MEQVCCFFCNKFHIPSRNNLRDQNKKPKQQYGADIWNVIDRVSGSLEKDYLGISPGMIICAVDGVLVKSHSSFVESLPTEGRVIITIARKRAAIGKDNFKTPTSLIRERDGIAEVQEQQKDENEEKESSYEESDEEQESTSTCSSTTESPPPRKKKGKQVDEKKNRKSEPLPPSAEHAHRHAFDDSDDEEQPVSKPSVPTTAVAKKPAKAKLSPPSSDDDSSESSLRKPKLKTAVHTFDDSDDD